MELLTSRTSLHPHPTSPPHPQQNSLHSTVQLHVDSVACVDGGGGGAASWLDERSVVVVGSLYSRSSWSNISPRPV